MAVALHINVDHVATLRQARGTAYPDPVVAGQLCEQAGADGVTVHLREDRRHIQDRDVEELRRALRAVLNLEMAATDEMVGVALRVHPDVVTLVPEKRQEQTTEGGLDMDGQIATLASAVRRLTGASIRVHTFIDPELQAVERSAQIGATGVEFHTGDYANASDPGARDAELDRLARAAAHAAAVAPRLRLAAGHGLTVENTEPLVARLVGVEELNIGHAVVADAVFHGLAAAVDRFRQAIARGVRSR